LKKDILFVAIQFILFALFFFDWDFVDYVIPKWLAYASVVIIVLGLTIILLGILNLSDSLSVFPSPKKNSELISNGIYRYIRHPIYTGILLAMFAYSLFDVSPMKFGITAVLVLVFYLKSDLEEKLLVKRYVEYAAYKNDTGRFFPRRKNNNRQ